MSNTTGVLYIIDANSGAYLGPVFVNLSITGEPGDDGEVMTADAPLLPLGAVRIDTPPTNPAGVLRGFTVADGVASGGTWDYSAVPAPSPDLPGFLNAIKAVAGTVAQANDIAAKYPNIAVALSIGEWSDAATLVALAHTRGDLTDDQYAQYAALATTYHIPLTLS